MDEFPIASFLSFSFLINHDAYLSISLCVDFSFLYSLFGVRGGGGGGISPP